MTPAFLTGLDMLRQMQALTGCCETQPPVIVYRERPAQGQAVAVVPDGWVLVPREMLARLIKGFEHVSGIARLWEPDHSSGSDRAKWARATEACADVAKALAAAPQAAERPTRGDLIAALRQSREALALPCDRWNATQSRIVREALATVDAVLRDAPPATPVA